MGGGKPPDFALEVISPSSEVSDRVAKTELYARIEIGEYFVFQPDPERAGPRLAGYALERSGYRELGPELGLEAGSVRSEVLGVSFRPEGSFLRVRDPWSGTDCRWPAEVEERLGAEAEARRQAEERAAREAEDRRRAEARREAEARLAALEARLGPKRQ